MCILKETRFFDSVKQLKVVETIMDWHSSILMLGAFQSAFLCFLLIFHPHIGMSRKWLAPLCLAISLMLIDSLLFQANLFSRYPHFIGIAFPISLLFSPIIYGYLKHLLQHKVKPQFLLHFVPVLIAMIMMMPFYFSSAEEKRQLLSQSGEVAEPFFLTFATVFVVVGVLLQGPIYAYLCFKKTKQVIFQFKSHFSNRQHITVAWIIIMQLLLLVFWLFDVFYVLAIEILGSSTKIPNITDAILCASVIVLSFLSFQKQALFSPLVLVDNENAKQEKNTQQNKELNCNKYENSALSESLANSVFEEIKIHIDKQQLFLDNDLTLTQLAKATGYSLHHVSQAINQVSGNHFFDFINGFRVEAVKHYLKTEPKKAIIDIGFQSGFNSKSAFYKAFRKHTGMTPSEYRTQLVY